MLLELKKMWSASVVSVLSMLRTVTLGPFGHCNGFAFPVGKYEYEEDLG